MFTQLVRFINELPCDTITFRISRDTIILEAPGIPAIGLSCSQLTGTVDMLLTRDMISKIRQAYRDTGMNL